MARVFASEIRVGRRIFDFNSDIWSIDDHQSRQSRLPHSLTQTSALLRSRRLRAAGGQKEHGLRLLFSTLLPAGQPRQHQRLHLLVQPLLQAQREDIQPVREGTDGGPQEEVVMVSTYSMGFNDGKQFNNPGQQFPSSITRAGCVIVADAFFDPCS